MILAIDIGSSSVIAGILKGRRLLKESGRAFFRSRCDGPKVEVAPEDILAAIQKAVGNLGRGPFAVEAVNFAVMCPAWVVMDRTGQPLTPLVTHQDRRSVTEAIELEFRVGADRHLQIAGNRPFPGGISSTTWCWFKTHQPGALAGADLVGHLNTFLHCRFTGSRVIDPSNASFTGLFQTTHLNGWSPELCEAAGVPMTLLPEILDADVIAGRVNTEGSRILRVHQGTPMLTGLMDGSAGMLLAGAREGQLFNVVGSTDVLALCTGNPRPHPQLLTRALGIGKRWLAVSTLAAAASSVYWARDQFFSELPIADFRKLVHRLSKKGPAASAGVAFEPYMAGERTSIRQRQGCFTGITLATTRENLLSAIIEALVKASADRLPLLRDVGSPLLEEVAVSGGSDRLDKILHRDWQGQWRFRSVTDATLRGLALIEPRERSDN